MRFASRMGVATVLVTASVGLAAAAPSAAAPSAEVSGDLVPTSATFHPGQVGDNLVLGFDGTHAWSGSFTGTSSIVGDLVIRPSGPATFRGIVTFTGNTPCGPATVRLITTGSGELPFLSGRAVTIGANDASESVHAQLDVSLLLLPTGAFVHYTGDVHCG
jgi:hypothetical protein